jgi:choice-of-anchor B domain-containing protein
MSKKVYECVLLLLFISCCSVSQNTNISLLGNLTYPGQSLSGIWGYASGGREYALCGASAGLSIVDVTNPVNPLQIIEIAGPQSKWREVAVFRQYAYTCTEGSGGALLITDLTNLPSTSLAFHTYTGDGAISGQLSTAHALQIDTTKKVLYLYGSNLANGGALAFDIGTDPYNPSYLGQYNASYIHGGFADNDTLYGAHIYQGYFSVIDFKDKANPIFLQSMQSPGSFTHSTALSLNKKTLFTTDELSGAFLASYDMSDLQNIRLLGKFRPATPAGSVPHYMHMHNEWAVLSWYRDGVILADAHRPQNMVEVGNYDTYPAGSGSGMDGAWGVYPYLPSGHLLAANVNEGLFILNPVYVRACYLEGTVSDSVCGYPLQGVQVKIDSTPVIALSGLDGSFQTGYTQPGTYSITFSKAGYNTKAVTAQVLSTGLICTAHIKLHQTGTEVFQARVINQKNGKPIAGASLQLEGTNRYAFYTDTAGLISGCNVMAGSYLLNVTKWGFVPQCIGPVVVSSTSGLVNLSILPGYEDDFSGNMGWTVNGSSPTPWLLTMPTATYDSSKQASPASGYPGACIHQAYVTNAQGGDAWIQDIDNGGSTLSSPFFDLSTYSNPLLVYDRWFYNGGYKNGPPNDSLSVWVSNSTETVKVETVTSRSLGNGTWLRKYVQLRDFIQTDNNMKLRFAIGDYPPDNIVEGGVCHFEILDSLMGKRVFTGSLPQNQFVLFPNPFYDMATIEYDLGDKGAVGELVVYDLEGLMLNNIDLPATSGRINFQTSVGPGMYLVRLKTDRWISGPLKFIRLTK